MKIQCDKVIEDRELEGQRKGKIGSESEKVPPGVPILTAACDVTWYTPAAVLDRTYREEKSAGEESISQKERLFLEKKEQLMIFFSLLMLFFAL